MFRYLSGMSAGACLLGLLLAACQPKEQPAGVGNYTEGVFVVNEGDFGGKGTITWHSPTTGETVQEVFEQANNGAVLGQFVQSLTLHDGNAYIVVNGANRVIVADARTFQYKDTLGGLVLPRFVLPLDANTVLVSQWGKGGVAGSVVKVDLRTRSIVARIQTGAGPEKMLRQSDGSVWVANSGGFAADSTISVLDVVNNRETARLRTGGKNPGSLANGTFGGIRTYAHCRGYFMDTTPRGWVGNIATTGTPTGHTVAPYGDDLVSAPDGSRLYFASGAEVYTFDGSGPRKWLSQNAYGLACDAQTGDVYCTDAKDFKSAGETVIYNASGQVKGRFRTGIAPSEIVFIR